MKIDQTKCVGCCTCMSACPYGIIAYIDGKCVINPNKCEPGCKVCASACPMQAITE